MALNSCASLGYVYERHLCLPVSVDVKQDEFTYDNAWIAGSFFFGLLLGIVIILLLAKYCHYVRKQKQDQLSASPNVQEAVIEAQTVNGLAGAKESVANVQKEGVSKLRFWRTKKQVLQKSENKQIQKTPDPAVIHGLADIILQTSKCMSQIEMAEQDMVSILSMERSKEEEISTLMQHILTILLRKKMKERAITKNFFHNFIKKIEEYIKDMKRIVDREREEEEEKLRNDPRFSKDTQSLETELQKLQTNLNIKHSKLQTELKNKIRQDLMRSSGLKENEINDLMAEFTSCMAVAEEKIGLEQERQRRALEIRLARRRQVIEYMEIEAMEKEQEKNARVENFRNILPLQINGSHRLESHADTIISDLTNGLDEIRKYQPKVTEFQVLKNYRSDNFEELVKNQNKEKAKLLQTIQQAKNPEDFIQQYLDIETKHHQETEVFWEKMDEKEAKEINKIKQEFTQKERNEMDDEIEKLANKLKDDMTSSEVERIMKLYKAEMYKYEAEKQQEKQAALARLQERLRQRLKTADFSEKQHQIEQEILKKQQMSTLNKVLTMNIDLTEVDKDQILKEHEQNMKTLSNQLLCSKLRQQKSLEIKINERKIQLENLHLRKKNLHGSNKQDKDGQLAQLSTDITKEEQLLEEARQAAVAELRKQLAKETEEALKLQTDSLSLLIGRLQLNEARRKVFLTRQEGTMQQTLDITPLASTEPVSSEMEGILKQHSDNMKRLELELQRQKEEKEKIIKEKISIKRQRLEQKTETELEEEAQYEFTTQQQKGVSYASLVLIQLLHKQRHEKRMQALNAQMAAELEKCRRDLNSEYELNLMKGLEVQMQDLLAKMTAMSKMSKQDVQGAISAVSSGNTDSEGAQQLVQFLRDSVTKKPIHEVTPSAEQPQ